MNNDNGRGSARPLSCDFPASSHNFMIGMGVKQEDTAVWLQCNVLPDSTNCGKDEFCPSAALMGG